MTALNDPATLRSLCLAYSEKVLALESKVDELSPRAAIADRISVTEGLISIRDAAKMLNRKERKLILWLMEHRWLYRDCKYKLRGYADKTPRYIDHKATTIPTSEGECVSLQAMITAAGLTRLADIFNAEDEVIKGI